jgi:hypothetical protein
MGKIPREQELGSWRPSKLLVWPTVVLQLMVFSLPHDAHLKLLKKGKCEGERRLTLRKWIK